jgi:hypothetical protein
MTSHDALMTVDRTQAATPVEVRARVNLIQEIMRAVFKEGMHYGRIPGTEKPTLFKAGSEVILATFRIAVEPVVDDLSTGDTFRYRVSCRGVLPNGEVVGVGIGEASSDEEKYRWRKAVCQEEYDETPVDRRRAKWGKGRDGKAYQTWQVRTQPADVANTILKMAKKRAQIDLCLTATAASDVFTQDIEDLPEELHDTVAEPTKPTVMVSVPAAAPTTSSDTAAPVVEGVTVTDLKAKTGTTDKGVKWTLWTATFSDGRVASTLDHDFGGLLDRAKASAAVLDIQTSPNRKYPDRLELTGIEVLR